MKDVIGSSNVCNIEAGGNLCQALLDTGANVSTISEEFRHQQFPEFELQTLTDFNLDITIADDHQLPYLGFIEMDVNIPNMNMEPVSSILLVVPDTKYSQSVPVVIGTNVLDRMLSKVEEVHGAQYHQRVCLPDAWSMAFRTLKIQSRAVARGKGCLAIVKCAARKNVAIPGNTSMTIQGKIDHRVFSSASLGVAEQLADSSLPEGMTITPVLMNVGADYSPVTIEVANLSSRPIVIEPSRTMCQIQSCAVETDLPADLPVGELNAALQKIDLNQSSLSEAEKQDVTKILSDWTDIFSANDLDVGLTSAVKHKIILEITPHSSSGTGGYLQPCTQKYVNTCINCWILMLSEKVIALGLSTLY